VSLVAAGCSQSHGPASPPDSAVIDAGDTALAAETPPACGPCHPEAVCAGPPGAQTCRQLSAGFSHACVLWADQIRCWGQGSGVYGETGLDTAAPVTRPPMAFPDGERPVQVSAGDGHSCAVMESGRLWCWGPNLFGQLGTGGTSPNEPRPVAASAVPQPLAAVISGVLASCGLTRDGKVFCWGSNDFSQLAIIGQANTTVLQPAESTQLGGPIRDFELAKDQTSPNTCALVGDTVRCWGRGSGFPQVIGGLTQVVDVEGASGGGCALEASGALRCWKFMATDAPPTILTRVRRFAAGHSHTCAITDDGRLHCWGLNQSGATGNGSEDPQEQPYSIPELSEVVQIAAGRAFTCAMTGDGRVWCWGSNAAGQLGLGGSGPIRTRPSDPLRYE
jgi:alpha-tubulin suppressor-like RCC1 family protein